MDIRQSLTTVKAAQHRCEPTATYIQQRVEDTIQACILQVQHRKDLSTEQILLDNGLGPEHAVELVKLAFPPKGADDGQDSGEVGGVLPEPTVQDTGNEP